MDILVIYILMLLIPIVASINVNSNYKKYKKTENKAGLTGFDVARKILDENGLDKIYIVETQGELTDCYDSSRKTVRLSHDIYHGTSISSLSIAAHECGHAIQDKEGYSFFKMRSAMFPVVSICERLSYVILIIGYFLASYDLIMLAIGMTATGLAFQLVTLPVELDASKRAKNILYNEGMADEKEYQGVKKVLTAAALTYVAGVLSSALDILYLLMRFRDRD